MPQEYGNKEWRKLRDVPRGHLLGDILGSTKLERKILGELEDHYIDINEREIKIKLIDEIVKRTNINRSTAAERVRKYIDGTLRKSKLFEKKKPPVTLKENDMIASIMLQTGCSRKTVLERLRKYKIKKINCDKLWEPLNEKYRKKGTI